MCKNFNFWYLQREYKKSLEQEIKGKGMLALATDTPDFMRARNATEILSQVWILNVFCIAFLEQWFPECELQAPDMKWKYYELIIYVKEKKRTILAPEHMLYLIISREKLDSGLR